MNIFEKINTIRLELSTNKEIKKSGKNKFAGFDYYQLQDFMPYLLKRMSELKLFSKFDLTDDEATLTIFDAEKIEDKITFTSPTENLTLKGCNTIQEIGGTHTYLKRYLYLNAFEITEPDSFDAVSGAKDNKIDMNTFEKERLNNIEFIKRNMVNLSDEEQAKLSSWITSHFRTSIDELKYDGSLKVRQILEKKLKGE